MQKVQVSNSGSNILQSEKWGCKGEKETNEGADSGKREENLGKGQARGVEEQGQWIKNLLTKAYHD